MTNTRERTHEQAHCPADTHPVALCGGRAKNCNQFATNANVGLMRAPRASHHRRVRSHAHATCMPRRTIAGATANRNPHTHTLTWSLASSLAHTHMHTDANFAKRPAHPHSLSCSSLQTYSRMRMSLAQTWGLLRTCLSVQVCMFLFVCVCMCMSVLRQPFR